MIWLIQPFHVKYIKFHCLNLLSKPEHDRIFRNNRIFYSIEYIWQLLLWQMGHVKRIWYLSPLRAAKVLASLRIHAVSPEPPLLAHTSSESSGIFRQKVRSLAPLNGWACAVKNCHDGMLEDTNSLDVSQIGAVTSPVIYDVVIAMNSPSYE